MAFVVEDLGRMPYREAWAAQEAADARVAAGAPPVLFLVEHPAVITFGRRRADQHLVASAAELSRLGIEAIDTDRGGDVTFHGPGQLVAYPIFDLRSFQPKVGAVEFVRRLEEVLIRTCGDFAIGTQRISGMTGVWTYALRNKPEAKIAALGVHISRGVTTHGCALNVSTDLDYFDLIVPCGLAGKPVTSMERELQKSLTMDEVAIAVSRNFGRVFQSQMLWLESLDDLLAQASAEPGQPHIGSQPEPVQAPANQDTPARPPKELRQLHGDGSELS